MPQTLDYPRRERRRRWPTPIARPAPTSRLFDEIAAAGIGRNVSLKLTQLGLTVDRATCVDNLRRILDGATPHEFFVRIDMEDSRYTQVTFDIFDTLWQQGYRNAGIAVQSYLPRTLEDVRRMNTLGARCGW